MIVVITSIIIFQFDFENELSLLLDKSGPYVGVERPHFLGYDGSGIKIALIDTGVDHLHPDLFGFGDGGKVVGGYNFIDDNKMPVDTNGHGTEVAGIIAADGSLKGIAPKSSILSYKVSEDGESVSSDLIIKAVEQAIEDEADIINISLGVNRTNPNIDQAVNKAVENGIVVIAAAGNDGPGLNTIGSPGKNSKAITVGATYNNITSSLVATLEVNEKQFQVLPMVGSKVLAEPITKQIVFGKYGRELDLSGGTFDDRIILVERGSDIKDEIVYFSEKEKNAADAGAKAILVYNNEPGIFFGELLHQYTPKDYHPRIPALSMSQEDGLYLKKLLENKTIASLNVFYHPDFVAYFSSRGPVSPFYIKPDLVAPGAFINTTLTDSRYNFTSGTSFAAPHVTGAAALLLQKNPEFTPNEIKSILVTTTDFVSDAYNNRFPIEATGAGRLNITKAFDANLIISPPSLIYNLSTDKQSQTRTLEINPISENSGNIKVEFVGPDVVFFEHKRDNKFLHATVSIPENIYGEFQGSLIINDDKTEYHVPVLIHRTNGTVNVFENDGKLEFSISHPENWSYAKISVINDDLGHVDTTSITPKKQSSVPVSKSGEYWILANINVEGKTIDAYETITVGTPSPQDSFTIQKFFDVPEKPIIIIVVVIGVIAAVGLKLRR